MAIGMLMRKSYAGLLKVAFVALTVLGLVLLGAYTQHLRASLDEAQEAARTAQEALKRTQATLAYRDRLRAQERASRAASEAAVQAALASAPDWAGTETPKEVQDAVCGTLDCVE